jgi:hypothetical protein
VEVVEGALPVAPAQPAAWVVVAVVLVVLVQPAVAAA